MKQKRTLSPPLAVIENRLFGVSMGLMDAVEAGETSARIAESVKKSAEWAARKTGEAEFTPDGIEETAGAMPEFIRELVERRVAAAQAKFDPMPCAGQIVEVRRIVTPKLNQLDWVMQVPLYVLLDAQTETPELWHGWLASAETDYASWWDFVLQQEDTPFDPEAGMVQLWNPVRLYLPMAGRVVAQLSLARLQAVRALAGEFATSEPPKRIEAWPGRVALRATLSGLEVVTGSPLGGDADPRRRYQQVYFYAAEAVREPARLAVGQSQVKWAGVGDFMETLVDAARRVHEVLAPVPHIDVAMRGNVVDGKAALSHKLQNAILSTAIDASASYRGASENPFMYENILPLSQSNALENEFARSKGATNSALRLLSETIERTQQVHKQRQEQLLSFQKILDTSLKHLEAIESTLAQQGPEQLMAQLGKTRVSPIFDPDLFSDIERQVSILRKKRAEASEKLERSENEFIDQSEYLFRALSEFRRLIETDEENVHRTISDFQKHFTQVNSAIARRLSTAGKAEELDLLWRDTARIHVLQVNLDGSGKLQIKAVGNEPVTCELRASGMLEDRLTAPPGEGSINIEWDGTEPAVLVLTTASGSSLTLPLTG